MLKAAFFFFFLTRYSFLFLSYSDFQFLIFIYGEICCFTTNKKRSAEQNVIM